MALGLALGVASWANYRSARDAVSTLHVGQAVVFEGLVMNAFRGLPPGEIDPSLDSLVTANIDAGLRFVGLVSPGGEVSPLGGTPSSEPVEISRPNQGPRLTWAGDRLRTFLPTPPHRSPSRDRARTQDMLMVEFEPLVAGQLMTRALRSLLLGAIAAGLLMLTALYFWRLSLRRETEERKMEEQRRLSTLGEFSAVLAHEIRNPLASLKGHAQLLAEEISDDEGLGPRIDRVVTEARRLETLTSDLLDFVRTGPLDLQPVKVESLLKDAVRAAGERANVVLDTSEAPETWSLDGQRMHQVLVNLLANAADASSEGSLIELGASRENGALVITVQDHGRGIPEKSLDRIFEPFFTTKTKGTGLGLALARRIVELHGGTLTARSRPEVGTGFRITLPSGGR
jgi:two-component system sensor histidine kinase HydH